MTNKASILIALLWCVALLAVVVVSVLHTARMDMVVTKHYGDKIQARYLALAGIERAKALLYQNAKERSRNGKNHSGELYNSPEQFKERTLGRGEYQVFRRARQDEGGGIIFGVSDEESRLNLNASPVDLLQKLEGLTAEIANAISAWRGENPPASPAAANADYYGSLQPPYKLRNGKIQTIRELLMIRGVSPEMLLQDDTQQNGFLDAGAEGDTGVVPLEMHASDMLSGWAGVSTVDSSVKNVNAAGQDRVNIQSGDQAALTGVRGITPAIAQAIMNYRNQNRFNTIADLLDVTPQQNNQNANQFGNLRNRNRPANSSDASSGPKVIDQTLFMDIADDVTVEDATDKPGLINVNTASPFVLACLPGMTRDLAQAITRFRQSNGFLPNIAWLLKVDGMTQSIFKQIAPLVTTRSETFRILCEGKIASTRVSQRIQVIVHVGLDEVTTLSYREDDL